MTRVRGGAPLPGVSVTGRRQPSEDKSGRAGPLWGGARCRPGELTVSGTRGNGGGGQSLKRKKTFLLSTRALDLYQKLESELKGTLNLGWSQPPHLTSVVSPRSHGQELDRAWAGLAARHPPALWHLPAHCHYPVGLCGFGETDPQRATAL